MAIDKSIIERCLGEFYNPAAEYVIESPFWAMSRINQGCRMVGQIETTGDGTMVILEKNPKREVENVSDES